MTRLMDILISLMGLFLLLPLLLIILLIGYFDTGSPLFRQKRVGLNLKSFVILKFRTMKIKTPSSGTHLIDTSNVTPFGYFLRKFKIDEFPQLWNVLKGDMSLVGPRPCLLNQKKLINERKKREVFKVRPGITGLSQVSDINMSKPILLAKTDLKMINKMNLFYYYYYIIITFLLIFKKKP